MDNWTRDHLEKWLVANGQEEAREDILDMVAAHPQVVERGDSWPEILVLARRNRAEGLLPKREEER